MSSFTELFFSGFGEVVETQMQIGFGLLKILTTCHRINEQAITL